jgi:hypothetical protein
MMDSAQRFSKQLGAMERLTVDLENFAAAAIELSEAFKQTVAVGSTTASNPDFKVEITEALELVAQKGQAFAEATGAFADPHGRTMRDLQEARDPLDVESLIQ